MEGEEEGQEGGEEAGVAEGLGHPPGRPLRRVGLERLACIYVVCFSALGTSRDRFETESRSAGDT